MSERSTQDAPRRQVVRQSFKSEDGRRARESLSNDIRKQKREATLMKRRNLAVTHNENDRSLDLENAAQQDEILLVDRDLPELEPVRANIRRFKELIESGDMGLVLHGLRLLRKTLSSKKHHPPIETVVRSNIIPVVAQFLELDDHPVFQFEAAWSLSNVASGNSAQTLSVLPYVETFVRLLNSPNVQVREQSVWALANITGDGYRNRDLLLEYPIVEELLRLVNDPEVPERIVAQCAWTFSNLTRGTPASNFERTTPMLETVVRLAQHAVKDIRVDALWALAYYSEGTQKEPMRAQALIDAGAHTLMMHYATSDQVVLKTPALRLLGSCLAGDVPQVEVVLGLEVLPLFRSLLMCELTSYRKEAAWAISNVTAGPPQFIQAVLDLEIIGPLCERIYNDDFRVKRESVHAISNAVHGATPVQVMQLIAQHVVRPMFTMLRLKDTLTMSMAFEVVERAFAIGELYATENHVRNPVYHEVDEIDGYRVLLDLQQHDKEDIYQAAYRLLDGYYANDDDDDDDDVNALAPSEGTSEFEFGTGNVNLTSQNW